MLPDSTDNNLLLCANSDSCRYTSEMDALREQVAQLKAQVRTDALTGLYNFRFLSETLPLEMERARRSFMPLSLILLDVDHFKQFNDQWGHEAGNLALQHVARVIVQSLRKLDFACRFGGEEFAIILPNTDLRQAINVAERLRELLASAELQISAENRVRITASLGVGQFISTKMQTQEDFLAQIDGFLYEAKQSGRNCVAHVDVQSIASTQVTPAEKEGLLGLFDGNDVSSN